MANEVRAAVWGATGTAGSAVVDACLADARVVELTAVTRRDLAVSHPKLVQVRCADFLDLSAVRESLRGVDVAFFCLGVSATQVRDEEAYRRITKGFAVAAATTLAEVSPGCVFHFVSGSGADPTGRSRMMWARVKGEAETAVLASGLSRVYVWRPSYMPPPRELGRRGALQVAAAVLTPVLRLIPGAVTPPADMARAMLEVTFHPTSEVVFGSKNITRIAKLA